MTNSSHGLGWPRNNWHKYYTETCPRGLEGRQRTLKQDPKRKCSGKGGTEARFHSSYVCFHISMCFPLYLSRLPDMSNRELLLLRSPRSSERNTVSWKAELNIINRGAAEVQREHQGRITHSDGWDSAGNTNGVAFQWGTKGCKGLQSTSFKGILTHGNSHDCTPTQ